MARGSRTPVGLGTPSCAPLDLAEKDTHFSVTKPWWPPSWTPLAHQSSSPTAQSHKQSLQQHPLGTGLARKGTLPGALLLLGHLLTSLAFTAGIFYFSQAPAQAEARQCRQGMVP